MKADPYVERWTVAGRLADEALAMGEELIYLPAFVWFRPGNVKVAVDAPGPEWEKAWPSRVPFHLDREGLRSWAFAFLGAVPYLTPEVKR